jgi:histidinol phosphatase-like PHP family hydrolase
MSGKANGISNAEIAELLAREAEQREGILQRAFKRAARSAWLWPEHATDLLRTGRSLTEIKGIGPFIARQLRVWLETADLKISRPPKTRRDFMTMADAQSLLAKKPVWRSSLRGDLQMHTQWSDGSGSVAEMAAAGVERGYEYIAITDHSQGLKIAGGIDERALAQQAKEIRRENKSIASNGGKLAVIRSIEMNLNPRGEGDMAAKALRRLDLVLGSFHSSLRTKEDQTERYLCALRHPHLHILGHPRGRIYNYRLGLTADWSRVFAEAAKLNKAIEIDSYPDRQDLNLSLLKLARVEGTRISLGTDAHHPWQLGFIELGLAAALKAKILPERIINFLSLTALLKWAERVSR